MSRLERYRAPSASHLLSHILDTPALVGAVRDLPASALARLIDHVGLEDAGELVALASRDQLQRVFDEQLWHGAAGGEEERFSVERFALWLSVMSEAGEAFVARTLSELPTDLLTLAVQRTVLVLDMDALTRQLAGDPTAAELAERALEGVAYEEWEEFALVGRDGSTWDVVWAALLALDRDHHDLLRGILERCAWLTRIAAEECGGVDQLLSEEELLEGQVADAREERRAKRGYLSAPDARAFLALCREPGQPGKRDPITAAYFRRLDPEPDREGASSVRTGADSMGIATASSSARGLLAVLREAEVLPAVETAPVAGLLTAGREQDAPGLTALMPRLATREPLRHAQALEELGYLANVLLAIAGREEAARPMDALVAAVHVCDLGLAQWPASADFESRLRALTEVTLDRLFRRGMQAVCEHPQHQADGPLAAWLPWLTN